VAAATTGLKDATAAPESSLRDDRGDGGDCRPFCILHALATPFTSIPAVAAAVATVAAASIADDEPHDT